MDVLSGRGRVCGCGKRGLERERHRERERQRERERGRLMAQIGKSQQIGRALRVNPII